ncbi:cAMP-dependent protein kinase catalytic subunit gamma-like [Galendromus occidentalis]|uniref:cAMP-dependent protein kinase catalytic subunit gamma-like n=1 Tax=Galendromus occidentalis TaxID=34638 RepID=A0AAJ6QPD6_9ACAR|nr:cAMP-dependent protein kinase catalytic subunit gamma-like [Galendromus occidentalis]
MCDARIQRKLKDYRDQLDHAKQIFEHGLSKNECLELDVRNLDTLGVIGEGVFGEIYRVEDQGSFYAVKKHAKRRIRERKSQAIVIRERKWLCAMNNPFVVKCLSKFKDADNVYLIMQYAPYGDVKSMLSRGAIPEERAVKIAIQAVLALEFLHAMDITLRNLEPRNLLVFSRGRVKLSDFGAAIIGSSISGKNFRSTPYTAPEMLKERPYTNAVDWWSMGVVIYEMLLAKLPFGGEQDHKDVLQRRITSDPLSGLGTDALSFSAKLVIQQFLEKEPVKRLGGPRTNVDDIKNHPWFSNVNYYDVIFGLNQFALQDSELAANRETKCARDLLRTLSKPEERDPLRDDLKDF